MPTLADQTGEMTGSPRCAFARWAKLSTLGAGNRPHRDRTIDPDRFDASAKNRQGVSAPH